MAMRQFTSVVVLLALAACAQGNSTTAEPTSPETSTSRAATGAVTLLAPGQSVVVGSGADSLRVTFQRVESDSRCPSDVQCVSAGDAAVLFRLSHAGREAGTELHTMLEPKQVEYDGFVLRLTGLTPAPKSTHPVDAGDYRAQVVVTK